jgi:FkbM family methyltransferase
MVGLFEMAINWRQLRRQLTPAWLRTDERRRRRDVFLRRLGIARCHTPPILTREPELLVQSWLPYVVAQRMLRNSSPTFLQIGAFDGVGDDDLSELIRAHHLRGVLVEPQPAAFTRLKETYADQPQVVLLQAAIAERDGVRDLFVRKSKTSMAASFDREHLRRHNIAANDIGTISVPCHTVASALKLGGLVSVDILQIDAEGYDWAIIRSIDFQRVRPAIVRFEYRNLPPADADACLAFLAGHGYRFLLERRDIVAVRPDDAVPDAWQARVA